MKPSPAPFDVDTHLASIIESSDDVIVSKTLEGVITSWNPAAERILGYTAAEAIGQNIRLIIPHDRWPEEDDVLARIRRGDRVDHFETVRRAKDGHLLNISLTVSPIRDRSGRIVGASKVARDITERKRAEAELERLLALEKQSRQQAEEASRLKDEFLAVVSHELRSPLNAITGWASLLLMRPLDEQTKHAIETILRNAQTQTQLVADLLDVSRIVTGQLRLNVRSFQLIPVIQASIEVVQPAADAKSIRIDTILDPSAGPVAGDPDRMQQIFWNLLSNAVKFTPRGGRIQVRLQRINSHVEVVVSDTGRGVDPKLLPHIFERFRQGDSSTTREHGGLGLGLAIVRHLVELHGGVVNAYSEGAGKGTEFILQLPIMVSVRGQEPGEQRVHPSVGGNLSGRVPALAGLRVLVVDDEQDAREIVSIILGEAGAEIATASSTREALDLMERWKPDVLISDIGMPGESGYDLIRMVRALPPDKGGRTPAIALTAYARTQDRLKILSAGFQMHVPKPIEPTELATVVASVAKRL
ncbi:MAG: ATP-binding protein [Candidatus Binatus sp.]|uniref:ATP-binding response regulator n=1 Tax=Candidatus Binatus sp. TaxID=2811406 RepID=UPI003BB1FF2A